MMASKIENLRAERSKLKTQLEQGSPLSAPDKVKQRISNITSEINKLKAQGERRGDAADCSEQLDSIRSMCDAAERRLSEMEREDAQGRLDAAAPNSPFNPVEPTEEQKAKA